MGDDRYSRQSLIQWWSQERLRAARVLIAGVGALGNEVAKNLALLGVGTLILVDFDRIERSNLSRTVLFKESDVGHSKAARAARALRALNPDLAVYPCDGDLFYDLGLGIYRHCDLTIGCLDSIAARSQAGRCCGLTGVPYLDGGMWSLGGEARWLLSGDGPCFDCTISADDRAEAQLRRSCTGFAPPADTQDQPHLPTVATTASIIGGLLAQECAKFLCGHAIEAGKSIVYNGQYLTMHRAQLSRRPDCPASHVPYGDVIELPGGAAQTTAADLIARARVDLARAWFPSGGGADTVPPAGDAIEVQLTRNFALAMVCPGCGRRQRVQRHWSRVPESARPCPACGTLREAQVVQALGADSQHLHTPLSRLGVPPGEILPVYIGGGILFYELTSDIPGLCA